MLGEISFSSYSFPLWFIIPWGTRICTNFKNYPMDLRKIRGVVSSAKWDLDAIHSWIYTQRSPPLPLQRLQWNLSLPIPYIWADGETRTPNPLITNQELCQLSYVSVSGWSVSNRQHSAWKADALPIELHPQIYISGGPTWTWTRNLRFMRPLL